MKSDATRKAAPEFSLKDANGRTVTLADYKGKVVLLNFWATWCGPCKMIAPMLDEIASEYQDKITIAKINIDDNPKTPQRFNVRGIPTLILFKNGQVEGQKVGALRKADLAAFLDGKL